MAGPGDDRGGTTQAGGGLLRDFDLLDAVGVRLARFADVPLPDKPGPRLDAGLVGRSVRAIVRDPRKLRVVLLYVAVLVAFTVVVAVLLVSGTLGDFYESIWRRFPGRPWTHVMRDHPWIYLVLAVGLGFVPVVLAPEERWGRALLTYSIFWIGFLGGHVFW